MRTAIISSSPYNLYAATLIDRLTDEGYRPLSVLCAGRPSVARLVLYWKRKGASALIRKALEFSRISTQSSGPIRMGLMRYAKQHDLEHWDWSLPRLCRTHGLEFISVDSVNEPSVVERVRRQNLDLLLNAGGEILRAPLIDATRHGILNAHMGRLPTYRGFNVLEWSLFYLDDPGVTLHFIDTGIDTGPIVRFVPIPITPEDDIDSLRAKSFPVNVDLMLWAIGQLNRGNLESRSQESEEGKQYFSMHPRLRAIAEKRIGTFFKSPDRPHSAEVGRSPDIDANEERGLEGPTLVER